MRKTVEEFQAEWQRAMYAAHKAWRKYQTALKKEKRL